MKLESYKKYGQTCYKFNCYVGVDPKTGRQKNTTRSGFRTKQEARQAYLDLMGGKGKTDRMRFEEVYRLWDEQYKLRVKESTYKKTCDMFRDHILPKVGDYYIDSITLQDVQEITNGWAKKLVNFHMPKAYMSNIFDEAIRIQVLTSNPCKLIAMPKRRKNPAENEDFENFYDKDELKTFLECTKKKDLQWQAFFRLLAFTGLRKAEALALTWKDINGSKLTVNKTLANGENNAVIVQTPKTPTSVRTIDIDRETTRILREWRMEQLKHFGMIDIVFNSEKGGYYVLSKPTHMLNQILAESHLKRITTHGLRHTHCSILFESGASIPEVQKRLGHKDIKTTMNIYNHISKGKKEEAVIRLASYLGY